MKTQYLILPLLAVAVSSTTAATITSVLDGAHDAPATWSDNTAPSAANDYVIDDETVQFHVNANTTFAGNSLTVQSGGTLSRQTTNATSRNLVIPNFSVDGGTILFRSNNQYARNQELSSSLAVASDSTIRVGTGVAQWTHNVTFSGGITGAGDINYLGNVGNSAEDAAGLYITTTNATYSGDWNINSIDTGRAKLYAQAAGALGSSMVALNTRSDLVVSFAGGIDSLSGVTLADASSALYLTNAWTNASASLTLTDGTLDLADTASSIGSFTIAGNNVGPGTYTASDLDNLGFGGTFTGTGTINVVPEPSSAALFGLGCLALILRRRK